MRSPTLYLQERQASTCLIGARCRAAAFLSDSESKVKAQPLPFAMVIPSETTKRYLPWVVATALFMEQLDSTILNIPVGLLALWFAHNDMPNFQSDTPRPLDVRGLLLFASGAGLLSWLLEVFGEINLPNGTVAMLLAVSVGLLVAYGWHAGRVPFPLLRHAFLALAVLTVVSSAAFWTLHPKDGESVSKGIISY